jgi:hypothetical protein
MSDVKVIVDTATGEHKYIPLSAEEIAEREAQAIQAEADRVAREAEDARIAALKESAKAKLVAGEALTEEEAELVVL